MGISLEHLAGNLTLAALKTKIRQKEEAGFELVTLARGRLGGQATNLATFRERSDGSTPATSISFRFPPASRGKRKNPASTTAKKAGGHLSRTPPCSSPARGRRIRGRWIRWMRSRTSARAKGCGITSTAPTARSFISTRACAFRQLRRASGPV